MPSDISLILDKRYKPGEMSERERAAVPRVGHEAYSIYTQRLASACEEGKEILMRLGGGRAVAVGGCVFELLHGGG